MKELVVIIDVSGSMYAMGKISVVGNALSTLSALENLGDDDSKVSVEKMQWDGTCSGLEKLLEKNTGRNILLLTDGYALTDDCKSSKTIKKILEENADNFFVVLCGGDSINVSAAKEFRRVRTVDAGNIVYAVECFSDSERSDENQEKKEDDWE
ncbi:MAG: VWA domain-containing protein [Treponema sp.]|nr:VWA domain-containing protein [Treponema sp.]